jgi:hypothetical protein
MVGATSRLWGKPTPETGLPPSDGSICSDVGFQDFWETSVGQRPTEAEAGILTVFLGGNAASTDEKWAFAAFRAGLAKMSPKMAEGLDTAAVTSMFWSARLAASPPPKSDNTPRCRTRRGNQLLTAACNLPANIGTAPSIPDAEL